MKIINGTMSLLLPWFPRPEFKIRPKLRSRAPTLVERTGTGDAEFEARVSPWLTVCSQQGPGFPGPQFPDPQDEGVGPGASPPLVEMLYLYVC